MPQETRTLAEAIASYDRKSVAEKLVLAEQQRQEVLRKFPMAVWPSLAVERYALGTDETRGTFCWLMEYGTPAVGRIGMRGARDHLIFRQQDGNWYFDPRFQTVEAAWAEIRTNFVEAFARAGRGQWSDIDALYGPSASRCKVLHCHFPDELLPISSATHLRHFISHLDPVAAPEPNAGHVLLNRLLLEMLRRLPELEGWSTSEMMEFLYEWANPRHESVSVYKIAPGGNAVYWDECRDNGYILVGWGDVGDLRAFDSKENFKKRFEEEYLAHYKGSRAKTSEKGNELWRLMDLEPGDFIVANKGTSKVLAVGTVTDKGYGYIPRENDDFNHVVHVTWDLSLEKEIPSQPRWGLVTVEKVNAQLAAKILARGSSPVGSTPPLTPPVPIDPLYREIDEAMGRKGQVVLYGPPGTGKTFHARRFAAWWIGKRLNQSNPERAFTEDEVTAEAIAKLSATRVGKRVWWVVANPKEWSWDKLFKENRVEYRYGRIGRNYNLVGKGDLVIGYQSTPDKKIVALARVSRPLFQDKQGDQRIELEPIARVADGLSYDELQKDRVLRASEPMKMRCQGTLFAVTDEEFLHLSGLLAERNPELESHLDPSDGEVAPLTFVTFHPSYAYEDFVEGFRPVEGKGDGLTLRLEDGIFKRVCRAAQANPTKPYLILIDEINRANVAKVLGELITLVEKDKRGLSLTLPQSKELFSVPPNVYLLGTMNTADRSIKPLDHALRRRFAFIELMPEAAMLSGYEVGKLDLGDLLEELNRRISAREGREKQIGHSFFLKGGKVVTDPDDFFRCFTQEILPQLQEYCYDEYRALAEYLGVKLVDVEAQTLSREHFESPQKLIEALEEEFGPKAETAP